MPGKHALVTGSSQGLGSHLAARLAQDGWKVTGLGRRPAAEASPAPGVDHLQADLSNPEILETLPALLGGVPDLVIHNAVDYPDRGAGPLPLAGLERVFRVNALIPYLLTLRLLAERGPEQPLCCIVVNSEAIFHADEQSGPYAASKAALRVLTSSLAETFRSKNASVATLLLGPLATPRMVAELRAVADKRGASEEEITRLFLRRSNPDLVIDELIDFEACYSSIRYIADLGPTANGMMCRLDGGSAGSLI
ncbi:SDR family NAD(P)-dependent oxidoreductase [Streptomyces sp. NBC_01190]|uniref:SDR family NAD(P)-dependent oxidoreductase n=1 Tax=Streptomyces sp. NBC_01190 TaxID=2903767 RepID=UPI00387071C2|nr:SDR family oxidoreductase [Streptomyces sp. NBC_01190]